MLALRFTLQGHTLLGGAFSLGGPSEDSILLADLLIPSCLLLLHLR